MKKWLIRIVVVVVVLVVVAVAAVLMSLDRIVKKGVETAGPMITKVDVRLDKVSISLAGNAQLRGLFVGNPPGYKTESAIKVGDISVALKPRTVLEDKVVIDSVNIQSPEITIEGGLKDNNLTKILANVNETAGASSSGKTSETAGGEKKIVIRDLKITGAKVNLNTLLSAGQTVTLNIPDIHLTNVGNDTAGVTSAELTRIIMNELMGKVGPVLAENVTKLGAGALGLGKDAGGEVQKGAEKLTEGIKGIFKK